jgi:hypothetical protein
VFSDTLQILVWQVLQDLKDATVTLLWYMKLLLYTSRPIYVKNAKDNHFDSRVYIHIFITDSTLFVITLLSTSFFVFLLQIISSNFPIYVSKFSSSISLLYAQTSVYFSLKKRWKFASSEFFPKHKFEFSRK